MSKFLAQSWWMVTVMAGNAIRQIQRQVMIKYGWLPEFNLVTSRTIIGRFEMCKRTTRGTNTVMAINANRYCGGAVIKMRREPSNGAVASFAVVVGVDVRRRFARGRNTVMAFEAAGGDAGMIEHTNFPRHRFMARCTIIT